MPALIAFVQIARWMLKRRWQPAGVWLAATVLASVVLAIFALVHAQFVSQTALQPDERYACNGWYFIWLFGACTVAWILTLSLLALVILEAASRWLNRQRPSCVVTE